MRRIAITVALAAAIATHQPSFAAEVNELLSGKTFPLTMKLNQLNSEWRGLSISGQFEVGDWMQSFGTLFGSLFGTGSSSNLYYTKGQTVTIGSETYMVAYRLQSTSGKVAPETTLALSLLNLRTIGSLNNIRSFNLEQEIATLERMMKPPASLFPSTPASPRPPKPSNRQTQPPRN